jgi:tripeptide aminopeptidase
VSGTGGSGGVTASEAASTGRPIGVELGELLRLICETPAPTFAEGERAALIERLWREAGLRPRLDEAGNVIADAPGGSGPLVILAAHLDTVFPIETDVRVREDGDRWSAPGIGDNSASLALLTYLIRHLDSFDPASLPRLRFVATVGEEGMGDLHGARALLAEPDGACDTFVAVDGHLGTIVDVAVGSKRYLATVKAAGGHSWGDFPAPSATHAVGAMVASLNALKVSRQPRSSYNVGQIWGGTSINAIAQEAGFNLDLRSVDGEALAELDRGALSRVRRVARRHQVDLTLKHVGERPAAAPDNRSLRQAARAALTEAGVEARTAASSTDANIAMAAGIPAVSFGVYRGGDAHRSSEWLELSSLETGYRALLGFLRRLAA